MSESFEQRQDGGHSLQRRPWAALVGAKVLGPKASVPLLWLSNRGLGMSSSRQNSGSVELSTRNGAILQSHLDNAQTHTMGEHPAEMEPWTQQIHAHCRRSSMRGNGELSGFRTEFAKGPRPYSARRPSPLEPLAGLRRAACVGVPEGEHMAQLHLAECDVSLSIFIHGVVHLRVRSRASPHTIGPSAEFACQPCPGGSTSRRPGLKCFGSSARVRSRSVGDASRRRVS